MDVQIKMNATDKRWLGIAFNKNRPEYRNLKPVWKGNPVQNALMQNFQDLFQSSGYGEWKISEGARLYKVAVGIPNISGFSKGAPNVWTGQMYKAMSKKNPSGGLRKYNQRSMFWGVDLNNTWFEMNGRYPLQRAKINRFALVSDKTANIVRDEIGDYLYNQLISMKGVA